ncbi:hypothetical protein [Corynebacterium argentoratense]|uniref:hypothetical protein n=1 Tax=Corynebacterium argentoratense TaxID=42817 RepID=UPI0028D48F1F|nr:hypothetical protein [Corynebacterium argentoratense]
MWGENYNRETNYLRVYLFQLRQKLEAAPKTHGTSSPCQALATDSSSRSFLKG